MRAILALALAASLCACASSPPPRAMTADELQFEYGYYAGQPMRPDLHD